jgi:hypothetical protein
LVGSLHRVRRKAAVAARWDLPTWGSIRSTLWSEAQKGRSGCGKLRRMVDWSGIFPGIVRLLAMASALTWGAGAQGQAAPLTGSAAGTQAERADDRFDADVEPSGGYASARPGVGLEVLGGYQPLIAITQPSIELGSSAQLATELYVTPWHPRPSSAIGLKAGYRYNTLLEHGFSVAITYLASLSETLAVEGLAGASIFPGSESRLRRRLGVSEDIIYGSSAQYYEYGLELIWYPF